MAEGDHLVEFVAVMRRLRAECPWKAEQTHRSLARYLLEEAHETLEAIDSGDADHLREELGDLLLQVYFHAEIASETGQFTIDDVAAGLTEKMKRRNPHVFGSAGSDLTAEQVNDQWQQAKADEKERSSVTDGLPPGLPALLYADKVLDRLSRLDERPDRRTSDGTSDEAVVRAAGSSDVLQQRLGERLLDLVREARAEGVDPEQALRDAVRREIDAVEG
ncbi:MazG family protein [Nocardioides sp. B-3]|uniref:MazG family protein n=1 Tax=Nocardioides sp. B-3 TaxID=2895565 RepID=UPI00215310F2|nr:MazG family protein [Nocardioides sp. B-3]UUZ60391.1 MazG family protein [Nocardioides sp. B-3]